MSAMPVTARISPWQVVHAARAWVGVPHHHQGRVRAGIDCVGVLVVTARALGIIPPGFDYTRYGRSPTGLLDALLAAHLVPLPAPQPGAVVALRWWKAMHHVGVVGEAPGALTLIHSLEEYGGVREHRLGAWHRHRVVQCYGFPGVAYEDAADEQ